MADISNIGTSLESANSAIIHRIMLEVLQLAYCSYPSSMCPQSSPWIQHATTKPAYLQEWTVAKSSEPEQLGSQTGLSTRPRWWDHKPALYASWKTWDKCPVCDLQVWPVSSTIQCNIMTRIPKHIFTQPHKENTLQTGRDSKNLLGLPRNNLLHESMSNSFKWILHWYLSRKVLVGTRK